MSAIPSSKDEAPKPPRAREDYPAFLKWLLPLALFVILIGLWEAAVRAGYTVPVVVSAPSQIWMDYFKDWNVLWPALVYTMTVTVEGFVLAVIGGGALAVLFSQNRLIEYTLYPYAIMFQVTPILAIAPLLLIIMTQSSAMLTCAFLVAFFPVLANTLIGLRSTDHNLLNLFELYGASGWQKLWILRLRSALPYFLSGVKISGGLSLIGAVVAELAAGSGGARSGLGIIVLLSPRRYDFPRSWAALSLLTVCGIVIFLLLSYVSHLLLHKWHESALKREN